MAARVRESEATSGDDAAVAAVISSPPAECEDVSQLQPATRRTKPSVASAAGEERVTTPHSDGTDEDVSARKGSGRETPGNVGTDGEDATVVPMSPGADKMAARDEGASSVTSRRGSQSPAASDDSGTQREGDGEDERGGDTQEDGAGLGSELASTDRVHELVSGAQQQPRLPSSTSAGGVYFNPVYLLTASRAVWVGSVCAREGRSHWRSCVHTSNRVPWCTNAGMRALRAHVIMR